MVTKGDLFRVKPGCACEGMTGLILVADERAGIRFYTVLLSNGNITEASEWWIEVISSVNLQPRG